MMKKQLVTAILTGLFISLNANAAFDFKTQQYTLAANYQYNGQNPEGTNPTSTINFSASPSVIFDDTHEFGGSLSYSITKSEVTYANTTSKTSTNMLSAFYRYNMPLSEAGAKIPIIGYFGPQVGRTAFEAAGVSSSDMSAGAQIGFNLMFSKTLALNIHALQFDTVFSDDTQLLITQSIGVKYFFE